MIQQDRPGFPELFQRELTGCSVSAQASWNQYSTLGAGTAPFLLLELRDAASLLGAVRIARSHGLRIFPLGRGTNLAGSDEPLPGQVFLKLAGSGEFTVKELVSEDTIRVGAACSLRDTILFALEHSLGGASALCGIPGGIGGALAMNAGAMGCSLSDFIVSAGGVTLFGEPEFVEIPAEELHLSYRSSPVIRDRIFVTELCLKFRTVDPDAEQLLIAAESERRLKAPKGRSAGSVFRNPDAEHPAGKLLEECSCKGLSIGSYRVSEEHANWIVKNGSEPGKESDFIELVSEMIRRVKSKYNVALTPEVRFVNMSSSSKVNSPLNVLVLKGGVSAEREVSLESGAAIAAALREGGYEVREYDIQELTLTPDMQWADVVWPVLHGGFGEDGRIQKLLEDAGICFVGSGSEACRLIMDKIASKKLMDLHGIPNAKYAVLTQPSEEMPQGLKLPLIVKPANEGSTFGLTLVETAADWKKAMELVFRYGEEALIEEFFDGVEATAAILDGKSLPVVEIRPPGKIYDYDAKYTHKQGETLYLCPPQSIPEELQKKIQAAALKFYEISGAEEILRVDVLASVKDGSICVLEGNSIPGCTSSSLVPKAAKAAGIAFPKFCSMMVEAAFKR